MNGKRGLLEGSNFVPFQEVGGGWRVEIYKLLTKKTKQLWMNSFSFKVYIFAIL